MVLGLRLGFRLEFESRFTAECNYIYRGVHTVRVRVTARVRVTVRVTVMVRVRVMFRPPLLLSPL